MRFTELHVGTVGWASAVYQAFRTERFQGLALLPCASRSGLPWGGGMWSSMPRVRSDWVQQHKLLTSLTIRESVGAAPGTVEGSAGLP